MDTHYKEFELSFHQQYNNEVKFLKFYEDLNDIDYENIVSIEENRIISLIFRGENKDARLYMEELDLILYEDLKEEELINQNIHVKGDEVYLTPSERKIFLCKGGVSPFIPGIYLIRIISNNKEFYTAFKVTNKMISCDEANEIIRDLEEELQGISFEFIKKKLSVYDKDLLLDLPKSLYKFFIIANEFPNIMNSLMELRVRPNYKVVKNYRQIPEEKVRYIDNVTIRNHLSSSGKPGFMKAPIKNMEYDLPENRWVKKIVLEVLSLLNDFVNEVEFILIKKKKRIEEMKRYSQDGNTIMLNKEEKTLSYINELRTKAMKMISSINILKSTEWYSSIKSREIFSLPHVLIQDSRYNILYKVYERLHSKEFNFNDEETLSLQWKRTDKLYEMWCYIKLCRTLNDLGYEPINNKENFYRRKNNRKLFYDLEENTVKEFLKDDIKIKVYYDAKIPNSSERSDFNNNPLFIRASNNKPDGRLDVYKDGRYLGSIIFEFKYRKREVIWDNEFYKRMDQGIEKQLIAYGTSCASKFILRKADEKSEKRLPIFPVNKVIILYPKANSEYINMDEVEDYNLKFIKFKPNKNLELLKNELKEEIELILENELL
ncbi:DUF2357 domain-containing protein [Clostridium sp. B9]|uniref:DUF2357 domain-containing protein n=1 Tax=Clostridium sp. B9 TaxID=3423224 RepID=UPI003D2EECE5